VNLSEENHPKHQQKLMPKFELNPQPKNAFHSWEKGGQFDRFMQ